MASRQEKRFVEENGDKLLLSSQKNAVRINFNHSHVNVDYDKFATYQTSEVNTNSMFATAWDVASDAYPTNWLNKYSGALLTCEARAVHAYTLEYPPMYFEFNRRTRTEGVKGDFNYNTYNYKAEYFYLSRALGKLSPKKTTTVYRGCKGVFEASIHEPICFGHYASTSLDEDTAKVFTKSGDGTLFVIETGMGSPIYQYSEYKNEQEILIPPYEKFEIVSMKDQQDKGWLWNGPLIRVITLRQSGCFCKSCQ